MDQIILINKEKGYSSFDVVRQLKRILKTKKIGHCGTLDPLAEGLLVITVGKACKAAQFIENSEKEYIGTITFGKHSLTYDAEGPFSEDSDIKEHSINQINDVLKSFIGKIKQKPPIYSALKKDGKRLYEYARENIEVEIKEREVEIKELKIIDYNISTLTFSCICSKGTYIRSLAVDIASKLSMKGYLSSLLRVRIGNLSLNNSYLINQVENNNYQGISIYDALNNYIYVKVDEVTKKAVMDGKRINFGLEGEFVVVDSSNNVIAFYSGEKLIRGLF